YFCLPHGSASSGSTNTARRLQRLRHAPIMHPRAAVALSLPVRGLPGSYLFQGHRLRWREHGAGPHTTNEAIGGGEHAPRGSHSTRHGIDIDRPPRAGNPLGVANFAAR
ncbi:MAG TPA: hypothetical protein VG963_19455, partial [Polyangiaceae bacterium]|nr:hypothetical protein [Polyangiaceae bacterium]